MNPKSKICISLVLLLLIGGSSLAGAAEGAAKESAVGASELSWWGFLEVIWQGIGPQLVPDGQPAEPPSDPPEPEAPGAPEAELRKVEE